MFIKEWSFFCAVENGKNDFFVIKLDTLPFFGGKFKIACLLGNIVWIECWYFWFLCKLPGYAIKWIMHLDWAVYRGIYVTLKKFLLQNVVSGVAVMC